MRFVSKNQNNFWVEDFNQEEKEFFLSIGFKEHRYKSGPKTISTNLYFEGSLPFGLWTGEEMNRIMKSILDHFLDLKSFNIEELNYFH